MMPVGLVQSPVEMQHLLAYMLDRSSGSNVPAAEADNKYPLALEIVHRFDPGKPNVFRFETIEAQYVRVDILPGSKGQPCIDEFEIFAPGSETNLALTGKATASSLLPGFAYKHQIAFLNDGMYGNGRSWIPANSTGWAQIKLVERSKIDRVVLSRDREGKLRARLLASFDVLVSNDGTTWKTVKKVRPRKAAKKTVKAPATKPEPGFKSIFNGKDLTGWEGENKAWVVRDGAIQSTGGQTKKNWLIWRGGELRDFELRLSFKFTKGNSGVQVRSKEIDKWQVRGYQVEIANATKMGLWHHSLAPEKYRSHLATAGQRVHINADGKKRIEHLATPAKVQSMCRDNDWNELVVTALGQRLVQTINGVVFAELVDEDTKHSTRSGLLALQDHGKGCIATFKDIRIKHLNTKIEPNKTKAAKP